MARRRGRKRGRSKHKIPILATAGAAVFALNAYGGYKRDGAQGVAWNTVGTDHSGRFDVNQFIVNVTPPVIGALGSMLAAKFGINRYIKIPMVKL
jgi:hypothetical protein